MTTIFVSHAKAQCDCAEHIRKAFESQGYTVWRDPGYPTPNEASYPQMIERAILGSAALVLVWSLDSSQDEWVERQTLFAQRLKKPIFAVALESTPLPNTLIVVSWVQARTSCSETVAALMALPNLPPPQSKDPLLTLSEQAAHEFVRVRKDAINAAAAMLSSRETIARKCSRCWNTWQSMIQ